MRLIGTIDGDKHAATFSDYLYTRDIENRVERNDANLFEIWVTEDDKLEEAGVLLKQFVANPVAPEYSKAPETARRRRLQEEADVEAAAERTFSSREVLTNQRSGAIFITALLIVVSISVGMFTKLGEDLDAIQPWLITKFVLTEYKIEWLPGFPEVMHGEVWRLVTPIFVHFGPLHLLFNMSTLIYLGSMIERAKGHFYLLMLVLVSAVVSNLAQFLIEVPKMSNGSPWFGGMSGVNYALFGYCWMKSKYDFASGIVIHPNTVAIMVIWFALCFSDIMRVANMAHAVGLVIGMCLGAVSSRRA